MTIFAPTLIEAMGFLEEYIEPRKAFDVESVGHSEEQDEAIHPNQTFLQLNVLATKYCRKRLTCKYDNAF
jgi:hypothetical protein